MGFFTRNPKDDADPAMNPADSDATGSQAPLQRRRNTAAVQRDNAANELRRRARRRLVGAIAMVLAAVIVLPMILDAPPETAPDDLAIEIPSQNSPFDPRFAEAPRAPELPAGHGNGMGQGGAAQGVTPLPAAPGEPAATATDPRVPASIATITPLPGSKPAPPPEPTRKPEAPARTEPATPPSASPTRPAAPPRAQEDDAARALALLQGRSPSASAPPAASSAPAAGGSSRYGVQVVAVRSRSGADDLLARLKGAGLSAYIETIKSPDGEVHRVRLGPYSSRAQAEAAQARLQGIPGGYQGNLVPL